MSAGMYAGQQGQQAGPQPGAQENFHGGNGSGQQWGGDQSRVHRNEAGETVYDAEYTVDDDDKRKAG